MAALRPLAIACAVVAGAIHAAVVPEHLQEFASFGVFFLIVAGIQVAWAIAAGVRPSSNVYEAGILVNASLIGLWCISRTVGLPLGPHVWTPEPVGMPDLVATTVESVLIAALVLLRRDAEAAGSPQEV